MNLQFGWSNLSLDHIHLCFYRRIRDLTGKLYPWKDCWLVFLKNLRVLPKNLPLVQIHCSLWQIDPRFRRLNLTLD